MSQGIVNPVAGLDVFRLWSLPFEIIGNSEVQLIRLPSDPPISYLQHGRRLLLRLGWVFEGLAQVHLGEPNVPTGFGIDGSTILRLLLLVLRSCREIAAEPTSSAHLDYRIWRELKLDTILWGMRLLMLSRYEVSIEEEDLIMSELQQVKESWRSSETLQRFETFAFDDLLPSALSSPVSRHVGQDFWQEEMKRIVEVMADTTSPSGLSSMYWTLHDIISEAQVRRPSGEGRSGKQPADQSSAVLRLIRAIYETTDLHSTDRMASEVVRRQLRRLFRVFGISEDEGVAQISGERYVLQDPRVAKRVNRILESEIKEFRRLHLSTWDDGSISRWQGRQTPLSPLSIRSEERNPSSLGSAESPTGSRISIVRRTGETEKRESMGTESRWNETRLEETPASFSTTSPVYSALKQPSQAEIQPSREREDKSSLQETAIWELRNLPVSPFIPGPNPDLFGPLQGNTLDPNTQVPPQEMDCAFPATSSSAEVVFPVSGLELNQFPSHTPPPKVPVDDRETYSTLREGSVRSAHSSRHQKAPSGDSQDYKGHAVPELDALKPTPTSSSASITSEKKARFFGFRRPTKQSLGPLPSGLRYQFSNCARYIMLWCKTNPEYIVRITHPFNSGSTFPIYLPTGTETKPHVRRDIRYLACTEDLIATLLHIESTRWIFTLKDNALQPLVPLDPEDPKVFSVAVPPNRRYIALGCGSIIILIRFTAKEKGSQSSCTIERGPVFTKNAEGTDICAHQLEFSADSSRIVSAVQVRGSHHHQVYPEIFTCTASLQPETRLAPVALASAASENTRITSVHSVESTDSAEDQKLLLTAAVTRPYYSILSTSRGAVSRILQVPDTCVLNCAQSWMLGTSHYFALRSGPGRMIVRVDGRTGTSQTVSSIAADARGIDLGHHESVALGMPTHDTIFALWRTANQGLMLKTFMFDGQRWVSAAQDLGLVYRQRAGTI